MIASGWSDYIKSFRCWLECLIIVIDTFALWYSVKSWALANIEVTERHKTINNNTTYFVLFGVVVILHAIRIFHIFYITLKPRSGIITTTTIDDSVKTGRIRNDHEIFSIDGILINRTFANMKFAAKSLLQPIIEDGLFDLFSMEFYGTREKPKTADHQGRSEHSLIADMMGSGHGLDIRGSMSKNPQNGDKHFHPGWPSWDDIFAKALGKAHLRNPEGGAVGVFFCGSPAIAKDLQVAAKTITARHRFAAKQMEGKPCACKLIVHSENF